MNLAPGTYGDDEGALVDSLSPRERQLLDMATNGLTDQAVANELGISLPTVSTYWGRIRIKFGPLGRTEIVARFLKALMTRATAELKASEARMSTVLEASPVGIFLTDADGRAVYVNAAYLAIAGEGEEELMQDGFAALVFPGDRAQEQKGDEGMGYRSEHRWERGDGTVVWVRLRSDAWYHEGAIAGRVGVVEDVTAGHNARQRQSEAEDRYRVLFELAPEAIVSVDERLDVVGFNPSAQRMFGYALPEILGMPLSALIPESFRARHDGDMRTFGRETGDAARPMAARSEVCGLRKDGTEFSCEASIVHQTLEGQAHYTAIVRDVSERTPSALEDSLDSIPLIAWRLDARGRLLYGNAVFREQVRPGFSDPVDPEDRIAFAGALAQACDEGESREAKVRLGARWHLCHVRRAKNGGATVVCTDVHEMAVAAEELRRVKAVLGSG